MSKLLGIEDPWVFGGYVIAIGSTFLCCVYGWRHRNEDGE
ncbi:MAG: symporter small accessory protein [Candidatus Methanomethylophilaceae archaeon]